jgi:hypothetical protein
MTIYKVTHPPTRPSTVTATAQKRKLSHRFPIPTPNNVRVTISATTRSRKRVRVSEDIKTIRPDAMAPVNEKSSLQATSDSIAHQLSPYKELIRDGNAEVDAGIAIDGEGAKSHNISLASHHTNYQL